MGVVIGISITDVSKCFGETVALDRVSLEIAPGEIFFLLGPSGCGKTTLLRCLAGFHFPDRGSIRFGGEEVTRLAAHRRQTGMVFQNYALWPHKTVAGNVAFGLEERKMPRAEIRRRVEEALAAVRMEQQAERGIHQLSGGQQQRVALARALVVRPRCLLLDEPLSNLDAKLRLEMRTEIRRICKEAGLTAVYVTHDQKEALSTADRLAVLDAGRVCQVGSPEAVYRQPASRFVADFVGETNFLEAEVVEAAGGILRLAVGGRRFRAESHGEARSIGAGERVTLSLRPEAWRFLPETPGLGADAEANTLPGRIEETVYQGEIARHRVATEVGTLKVYELNPGAGAGASSGGERECLLEIAPRDVVVLEK